MNKAVVPVALVVLAVAGLVVLGVKSHKFDSVPAALSGDKIAWDVGYPKNQLDPPLEATATHEIDGGGNVFMTATCASVADGSSITLEFEYHAKSETKDNDADSYFEKEGSGNFEHVAVPYSFDGGEVKNARSETNFKNTAQVVFAYISPNAKVGPIEGLPIVINKLFGGIQDLQPFLHAHEVKFQLPLGGGTSEIVSVYPQDNSFQDFVGQCKIDLKQIDAEAAKKQDDGNAPAQNNVEAPAAADAQQTQQPDAAAEPAPQQPEQPVDAVQQACTTGQGQLRVKSSAPVTEARDGKIIVYAQPGEIVRPVADNDAVSQSNCSVEYVDGNNEITGWIALAMLETALAPSPPADAQSDTQGNPQ